MAVAVTELSGGTILTTGSVDQVIGAAITAGGVFFLRLDLSVLVGGPTPDIIEVAERLKVRSGATLRDIENSRRQFVGGLAPALIEFPQRPIAASCDLTYVITRIQGTDRTFTYSIHEIG